MSRRWRMTLLATTAVASLVTPQRATHALQPEAHIVRLTDPNDPAQNLHDYDLLAKLKKSAPNSSAQEIMTFLTSLLNAGYDKAHEITKPAAVIANYDIGAINDAITKNGENTFGLLAREYNVRARTYPTENASDRLRETFDSFRNDDQGKTLASYYALILLGRPAGARPFAPEITGTLNAWAYGRNGSFAHRRSRTQVGDQTPPPVRFQF